jgi:hypothetical protein
VEKLKIRDCRLKYGRKTFKHNPSASQRTEFQRDLVAMAVKGWSNEDFQEVKIQACKRFGCKAVDQDSNKTMRLFTELYKEASKSLGR